MKTRKLRRVTRDIDERYELVDGAATIASALEHIPERERTVLALRFIEDLTQSEIAERIGYRRCMCPAFCDAPSSSSASSCGPRMRMPTHRLESASPRF